MRGNGRRRESGMKPLTGRQRWLWGVAATLFLLLAMGLAERFIGGM